MEDYLTYYRTGSHSITLQLDYYFEASLSCLRTAGLFKYIEEETKKAFNQFVSDLTIEIQKVAEMADDVKVESCVANEGFHVVPPAFPGDLLMGYRLTLNLKSSHNIPHLHFERPSAPKIQLNFVPL